MEGSGDLRTNLPQRLKIQGLDRLLADQRCRSVPFGLSGNAISTDLLMPDAPPRGWWSLFPWHPSP